MTLRIVIATHTVVHVMVVWVMVMHRSIRTDRMVIMVPIAVIPIQEWINAMEWMPPMWIVSPIVWRMPTYPRRPPEPIVNNWTIDIYWFDNVIRAIYILVTNNLYSY